MEWCNNTAVCGDEDVEMRGKKVKALRQYLRSKGHAISAEPYKTLDNRMVIASENRQKYQQAKKAL